MWKVFFHFRKILPIIYSSELFFLISKWYSEMNYFIRNTRYNFYKHWISISLGVLTMSNQLDWSAQSAFLLKSVKIPTHVSKEVVGAKTKPAHARVRPDPGPPHYAARYMQITRCTTKNTVINNGPDMERVPPLKHALCYTGPPVRPPRFPSLSRSAIPEVWRSRGGQL